MKLECIITLANPVVRLRLVAMERSLRATGCTLPLKVIPYDADRFQLPPNATWWEVPELVAWLAAKRARPVMRKYQCLLAGGYQFVDADVVFLRDPGNVLAPLDGFVTSCGHWHNPGETLTPEFHAWLVRRSTTWQKSVFNTGQFACDRALYALPDLLARAGAPEFAATCVTHEFHEQPGLNWLVLASSVPVRNLTLPPFEMQSTWAGDYPGEFRSYWRGQTETPFLIHWAGTPLEDPRPIDALFLDFLTAAERVEWKQQLAEEAARRRAGRESLRARARRLRDAWRSLTRPPGSRK